jgi:hypothetical protein
MIGPFAAAAQLKIYKHTSFIFRHFLSPKQFCMKKKLCWGRATRERSNQNRLTKRHGEYCRIRVVEIKANFDIRFQQPNMQ